MKFLNALYQHINILSLDVVGGAVVSALFFGALLRVFIPFTALVALAFTVWIIYTLDHLQDAMTIPGIASTDRHRFHQQHFRVLFGLMLAVALLDVVLLFFLPSAILRGGIILGAIVLFYLIMQRYLRFLKEFFVACLYTAGIMLPAVALAGDSILPVHYLVAAKFFITALMNLLLFSLFDYREDRHHQQHSFVTWFGQKPTRASIVVLGLLNIVSGLWLWDFDSRVAVIFVGMNVLLLTILVLERRLLANNLYRILGDAVFLFPVVYLL